MIFTTQTIYWMKWIYPAWPPSQFRSKTRRVLMWDTAFGNIWKETHLSWPATSVKSFEPSSLPRAPAYYKNRCYHCPVLHLWKLVCLASVSSNIFVTPRWQQRWSTVWRPRLFVDYWLALCWTPALQISHHGSCDSTKTTIVSRSAL